jgi:hypothetical protein
MFILHQTCAIIPDCGYHASDLWFISPKDSIPCFGTAMTY